MLRNSDGRGPLRSTSSQAGGLLSSKFAASKLPWPHRHATRFRGEGATSLAVAAARLLEAASLRVALASSFRHVSELFEGQQARGAFPGGQLVVMREGQVLHEQVCGVSHGFRGESELRGVTLQTRFQVMSASKPFVAFAVALLEDAQLVDVMAPVARYIPEFAHHGKQDITVLDVLLHRSGVLVEAFIEDTDDWSDWSNIVRAMSDAEPRFARGTLAYSPAGFGWILGELVQRVSGKTLQQFLSERLPPELSGVRFVDAQQHSQVARSYWLGPDSFMLAGHNIAADFEHVNNELTSVTACVPGAGLLASARELAHFYDLLVRGGCGLLRPETLAKYVTKQTFGLERQMHVPLTLGRGFGLGSVGPHAYGWFNTGPCFGHAGGFGVVAFADPRSRTAVAIVTNGHRGVGDLIRRFAPLGSAIKRAARAS
jgi:CubicO group peptidase (beta-lactamase class C family)